MISFPNRRHACNPAERGAVLFRCGLIVLLALISFGGSARQVQIPHRITILVVAGLIADDINAQKLPALTKLIDEGESGWMVCRAAKPADPDQLKPDGREPVDSLMLSLGCGGRARCGIESDGIVSPTPHNLHVLPYPPPGSLNALKKANAELGYTITVGALGDIAHHAGMKTTAIGNMDSDRPDRSVYLMAMDSAGVVDNAGPQLGKVLSVDTAPFGIAANMDATLAAYDGVAQRRNQLVIIAVGDLYRADRYTPYCLPHLAKVHRGGALSDINHLIEQITLRIRHENATGVFSRLIVISPGPADSTPSAQDTLAPIVLWGGGITNGEVTSLSTHRTGLVVNTDVLATVAEWLDQAMPPGATGRPIVTAATADYQASAIRLRHSHDSLIGTAVLQNLLGGLPTVQAVLVIFGLVATGWRGSSRSERVLAAISAAIVSLPLGMLVLPALRLGSPISAALCLLVFVLVFAAVAWRRVEKGLPLVLSLSGALIGLICVDLATGCHLLQSAWMSYSAAGGSRFYGIGNEYMGAVIGAIIVLFPCFAVRRSGRATGDFTNIPARLINVSSAYFVLFTVIILLMAAPFAGAKAGAIPSATAAAAILMMMDRRGRIIPRDILVALLTLALIIAAAAIVDSHGSHSHLVRSLTGEGGDSITVVIRRKLSMDMRLLRHSPWTFTLLAGACTLAVLGRKSNHLHKIVTFRTTLAGLWWGAAACLICNDAGVLAASMVMLYGCAWAFTTTVPTRIEGDPT